MKNANALKFKPMLSGKADLSVLRFPVFVSPKLDGVRAVIVGGKLLSRTLKPIPNRFVRETLESLNLPDVDGELIVGNLAAPNVFNVTTSAVMRENGKPDFGFYVFDRIVTGQPFDARYASLSELKDCLPRVHILPQTPVKNREELDICEARCVEAGYEGIMIRAIAGRYKFGRSTVNEGWLLKLKRFTDEEAKVVGFNEEISELDKAKGSLGSLICQSSKYDDTFDIGTGFDQVQRKKIWLNRESYLGKLVCFKHQPVGQLNKPRFPVFKGWRHPDDL